MIYWHCFPHKVWLEHGTGTYVNCAYLHGALVRNLIIQSILGVCF